MLVSSNLTQPINCSSNFSKIDYTHSNLLVKQSCFELWQLTDNQKVWKTTRNYNPFAHGTTPYIFLIQTLLTVEHKSHTKSLSHIPRTETLTILAHKTFYPDLQLFNLVTNTSNLKGLKLPNIKTDIFQMHHFLIS